VCGRRKPAGLRALGPADLCLPHSQGVTLQAMTAQSHRSLAAGSTIGFGSVLAIVLSWTANKAILWAILHGVLGWFYVIYYLLFHKDWTWL
jgi:hypothetical protein